MLCETHRWNLATFSTELAKDADYVKSKTDLLLKRSQVEANVSKARFEQHREELRNATTVAEEDEKPIDTEVPKDGEEFEMCPSFQEEEAVPPPLSADCKIANQDFLSVSFIKEPKTEEKPEFLFYVYIFSKSEDDLDGYVRNVASRRVKEHDILTLDACEWVFPFSETKLNKIYRDDRLNDFMNKNSNEDAIHEVMNS